MISLWLGENTVEIKIFGWSYMYFPLEDTLILYSIDEHVFQMKILDSPLFQHWHVQIARGSVPPTPNTDTRTRALHRHKN